MKKQTTPTSLPEELRQQIATYINSNFVPREVLWQDREELCAPQTLERAAQRPTVALQKSLSMEDFLRQEDAGFTEKLLHLIDKTGKKDSEIYKKANLSKQHFSKIRNNLHYRPTKSTALALAIALELDLEATRDLIGRAGYALTNSSKADLIIRYFIENQNYNIVEINLALYEFDQALLGV